MYNVFCSNFTYFPSLITPAIDSFYQFPLPILCVLIFFNVLIPVTVTHMCMYMAPSTIAWLASRGQYS